MVKIPARILTRIIAGILCFNGKYNERCLFKISSVLFLVTVKGDMSDAIGGRVEEYYDQRIDGLLNTTERQRINQYVGYINSTNHSQGSN